ncbi:hypothetical protein ACHWQZ_G003229 [Mnemiopsis leidyi]
MGVIEGGQPVVLRTAGQCTLKSLCHKKSRQKVANKERKTIKAASRAIELGSVVILVEEDIPLGAIALLGKGLGYVPTPAIDKVGARLDMKLLTNKILNQSNINLTSKSRPNQPTEPYSIPSKLRKNNYSSALPSSDDVVNEAVNRMKSGLDEKLRRPPRKRAFTFDYKALYDSLDPELTIKALSTAMDECRENWNPYFKQWMLKLVDLSLRAAVGMFNESWYKQKRGVPTGGSLCVQIANIAVYYIMRDLVYSDETLMKHIKSVKRYIDDGSGAFSGTKRQFGEFIKKVNDRISCHGLNIDEHCIEDPGEYVAFLDIQFCFDGDGNLKTDLYVKETDSRSYLYYGSSHPNHTFSSIVYSTSLRLRRIINNSDRLKHRIEELKECFFSANYPKKMVNNVTSKVCSMERRIKSHNDSNSSILVPTSPDSGIRVISTYNSDLRDVVMNLEPALTASRSFSSAESSSGLGSTQSAPPTKKKSLFNFVNRTGSSLRKKLVSPTTGQQLFFITKGDQSL